MALNVRSRDWRGEPAESIRARTASIRMLYFNLTIPVRMWRTYSRSILHESTCDRRSSNCVHLEEPFIARSKEISHNALVAKYAVGIFARSLVHPQHTEILRDEQKLKCSRINIFRKYSIIHKRTYLIKSKKKIKIKCKNVFIKCELRINLFLVSRH